MKPEEITDQNYYGQQASYAYLTNSQRKTFCECQARWLASILGEWTEPQKDVYFHGQYVDVALTESPAAFAKWSERHQAKIYGRNGKKYKVFLDLDKAINTVRNEPLLMEYLTGEPQTIIAIEDFHGVPFKCKLDCLNLEKGFITDLKTTADLYMEQWSPVFMERVSYIDLYSYWTQAALYKEAVWVKYERDLPFYIVAAEKKPKHDDDSYVNRQIYHLDDTIYLENEWRNAVTTMLEMQRIKEAAMDPHEVIRCEKCSYCISTKVLTEPISIKPKMRF